MRIPSLSPRIIVLIAVTGMLALSVAGCTAAEQPPKYVAALITPMPSEHGVGRTALTWTDATRKDPTTVSGKRELRGWLYYPTKDAPAVTGVALDGVWAAAWRPSIERKLGMAAAHAMLTARWHASADIAASGRFPVLIFTPGYRLLPTSYSALLEGLASRGYIVLAIASPGISGVVPLSGNRLASAQPIDDSSYDTVAKDIASAIATLPALDAAANEAYAGHLDLDRIGVFGHSVGGAAAILASARVPQVRAAANLDGDFMGLTATAQPRVPLLYVTSQPPDRPAQPISDWSSERNEVRRERIWRSVTGQSPRAIRVRVSGMFHSNFEDSALLPPSAMTHKMRKDRYGTINGARGLNLSVRLLAGFFAKAFGGPTADGVSTVVAQFPESDMQVLARPAGR